jgi:hypothetical protein
VVSGNRPKSRDIRGKSSWLGPSRVGVVQKGSLSSVEVQSKTDADCVSLGVRPTASRLSLAHVSPAILLQAWRICSGRRGHSRQVRALQFSARVGGMNRVF